MILVEVFLLKHLLWSFSFSESEGRLLLCLLPGNSSRPYKIRHSALLSLAKAVTIHCVYFEVTCFNVGKRRK
jgi:hypothetical protein